MPRSRKTVLVEYGMVVALNAAIGVWIGGMGDSGRIVAPARFSPAGSGPAATRTQALVRTELPPGYVLGGSGAPPSIDRAGLMRVEEPEAVQMEYTVELLKAKAALGYTVSPEAWRRAEHREVMAALKR